MSEQNNADLVRRHFEEIWNRRDFSACNELMAADFVENGPAPFRTRAPGRDSGLAAMPWEMDPSMRDNDLGGRFR